MKQRTKPGIVTVAAVYELCLALMGKNSSQPECQRKRECQQNGIARRK